MGCTIFKRVSQLYRKLFQPQSATVAETASKPTKKSDAGPTIIPRNQHTISRKAISENALKVLYRLNKQGYQAYLVGGCVRDLLLNQKPKDFDVTTNATPEQVQKTFRNCRLVGRRFKLAHILFGREIIEVATFRGDHQQSGNQQLAKQSQSGMLLRDNVYGTIEDDAKRRDFTINSLYYNVKDFTVRDYCNGLQDLQQGIIRLIGEPEVRYREDPVRMLRAVRFAAKLDMQIEAKTAKPIANLAPLLSHVPAPRLFDEMLKLLQSGYGFKSYQLLQHYQLFGQLFPQIERLFVHHQKQSDKPQTNLEKMLQQVLKNTDYRIANHQRVNPAFLLAALLWYPLTERTQHYVIESGLNYHEAFALASSDVLQEQCKITAIPRRITTTMNEIWQLQLRLKKRLGKKVYSTFEHPKFKAAFDLLELRSAIEKGELLETAKWWDEFLHASTEQRHEMVRAQNRSFNARRRARHNNKKSS